MRDAKIIKIFGLPRTCTNLTTVLLRKNFKCLVLDNNPCWKHGYNTHEGRTIEIDNLKTNDLKFVICTKNPIDWLWSLFCFENETKRKIKRSAEDFLTKNSWHYDKELKMTPIEAYNKLNKHWLEMFSESNILQQIKFEDLHDNQEKQLEKIEKAFGLERTKKSNKNFELLESIVAPNAKIIENQKFKKRKVEWNEKQLNIIINNLDKKIVDLCGYKIKISK